MEQHDEYPKYKGVRLRKWGKWVSEIRLPNSRERIWLGSYDMAEKAARAFDAAQFCLRGPHARFNFPESPPDIPGGQSLSPHEIQVVAAKFANDFIIKDREEEQGNPNGFDIDHHSSGEPVSDEDYNNNITTITNNNDNNSSSSNIITSDDDGFNNMDWSLLNFLDYSSNNIENDYFAPFTCSSSGLSDQDHHHQYSSSSGQCSTTVPAHHDDHNNNSIIYDNEDYYSNYPFITSTNDDHDHHDDHYSHSSFLWNF
ncbi:hypothetical protein CsatA_028628 [Cannabis sativa]